MSVGSPFHPRTAPLNRKMQWREWSGYFASSAYADAHDIEYNAVREAAALFDVSPLYKYIVSGPDATRLVDRVITRDATKLKVGGVVYSPWCDENGKVVDDGTIHRLDEDRYRWTAADPQLRWLRQNSAGLDVTLTDESEATAALALQGPLSRAVLEAATGESFADLGYFKRRASSIEGIAIDVSRTGYTGDLGYELWLPTGSAVAVWDAVMAAGAAYGAGALLRHHDQRTTAASSHPDREPASDPTSSAPPTVGVPTETVPFASTKRTWSNVMLLPASASNRWTKSCCPSATFTC